VQIEVSGEHQRVGAIFMNMRVRMRAWTTQKIRIKQPIIEQDLNKPNPHACCKAYGPKGNANEYLYVAPIR
jgi:hypothetical protein